MAMPVIFVTPSHRLAQALTQGNSQAGAFATMLVQEAEPSPTAGPIVDGVYDIGQAGMEASERVFVMPYAQGGERLNFSMRIWAWRHATNPLTQTGKTDVWIPYLLAEFACTTGNVPGLADHVLNGNEYLADTIVLANGSLGARGEISVPLTDTAAYAIVEVRGAKKISFDFQQTDPVGMNAFWARI